MQLLPKNSQNGSSAFATDHRRWAAGPGAPIFAALILFGIGSDGAMAMGGNRGRTFLAPQAGFSRSPLVAPRTGFIQLNRVPPQTSVHGTGRYPGKTVDHGNRPGTHKPRRPHRPPVIVRIPPYVPLGPAIVSSPPSPPPPARTLTPGPARPPLPSLPLAGEQRYVPDEVLVSFAAGMSQQAVVGLAQRQRLALLAVHRLPLINTTLYRFRITDGRSVSNAITALGRDRRISRVQPNFLYATLDDGRQASAGDPAQYVLRKLEVVPAHAIATGAKVRIAVIDTSIDGLHPDLAGSVAARFDAVNTPERPHKHGTAMASAIAAHGKMLGIAPAAQLLAVRAFDPASAGARSTTARLLDSLQWSVDNGARIVNMSFAGPDDPRLHDMLIAVRGRGIVLIAAAGNSGPSARPAYPASYPEVIAVTATDPDDGLFAQANRGAYVAVAAPGVDVLAAAPGAGYDMTTGTSVAAAHVSGLAALLLERRPQLSPDAVATALARSARDLGAAGRDGDYGAGLVNALEALNAVAPQTAEHAVR